MPNPFQASTQWLLAIEIEADSPILNLDAKVFVVPRDSSRMLLLLLWQRALCSNSSTMAKTVELQLGSRCIGSQIVVELDRGAVADLAIVKQANKCRSKPGGLRLGPQRYAESKDSTVVVNLGTVFLRSIFLCHTIHPGDRPPNNGTDGWRGDAARVAVQCVLPRLSCPRQFC